MSTVCRYTAQKKKKNLLSLLTTEFFFWQLEANHHCYISSDGIHQNC